MYPFDPYHRRKTSYDSYVPQPYRAQRFYSEPSYQWQHEMDYTMAPRSTPNLHTFAQPLDDVARPASDMSVTRPGMMAQVETSFPPTPMESDNGMIEYNPFALYHGAAQDFSDMAHLNSTPSSVSNANGIPHNHRFGASLGDSMFAGVTPTSVLGDLNRRTPDSVEPTHPMSTADVDSCNIPHRGSEAACLPYNSLVPIEECATIHYVDSSRRPSSEPVSPVRAESKSSSRSRPPIDRAGSDKSQNIVAPDSQLAASVPQKPAARRRTKVKATPDNSIDDSEAADKATKLRARQAHSLVERKYRENLNLKIVQLHDRLQHTRFGANARGSQLKLPANPETNYSMLDVEAYPTTDNTEVDGASLYDPENESTSSNHLKVRKSDVMVEAMNYINSTEAEMKRMVDEMSRLNAKMQAMEKMMGCHDCGLWKQMMARQVSNTT